MIYYMPMKERTAPFPGLTLSAPDREDIALLREGALKERVWRRIRILELLDKGFDLASTGRAVGTYPREVRRVGRRYLSGGLHIALCEDARPAPERLLDHRQESAIVAMVCSDCPDERSRWTIRLVAEEAQKRGIVKKIGRETVRQLLERHELKPWRKKNVVRAGA
jgi:hypothetical protein